MIKDLFIVKQDRLWIIKKNQTKGEVLCNMLDWEKQV